MNNTASYIYPGIVVISYISTIAAFSAYMQSERNTPWLLLYAIWLLCAFLCFAFLQFLLIKKERTVRFLVRIETVFLLFQTILSLIICGKFESTQIIICNFLSWGLAYVIIHTNLTRPFSAKALIDVVDLSTIVSILLFLIISINHVSFAILLPSAAAAFLSLMALTIYRTRGKNENGQNNRTGYAVAVISGGSICVVSVLLAFYGDGFLGTVILFLSQLLRLLWAILRWMGRCILIILDYLNTFFSATGGDIALEVIEKPSVAIAEELQEEGGNPVALLLCLSLLTVSAFVAFFWYLYHGRADRIVSKRGKAPLSRKKIKPPAHGKLWKKLIAKLRFEWYSLCYKNTAKGMLVWLDKHEKRMRTGRSKNETCAEFISRVSLTYPMAADKLKTLSDALDSELYGGIANYSKEQALELRMLLKKRPDAV